MIYGLKRTYIKNINKEYSYLNNGIKYQKIPYFVNYVENFEIKIFNKEKFENSLSKEIECYLNLFRMIIAQGLIDINSKSINRRRKRGRESAKKFFRKNNKYLIKYCKIINEDPNYILKIYKKIKFLKNRKDCLIDTLNMYKISKILKRTHKYYQIELNL